MSDGKRPVRWAAVVLVVAAVALAAALMLWQPAGTALGLIVRASAVLGYEAAFLATLSSVCMAQMKRLFGRPFLKVHHLLSVSGLVLMTLHPLGVAIDAGGASVFVPRFDTARILLRLGGRPAWYLFGLAALSAALKWPRGRAWRVIHWLNYAAFALVTTHALAIGTDFQDWPARAVPLVFALIVAVVLVMKRVGHR